jgi:hypothetical protein
MHCNIKHFLHKNIKLEEGRRKGVAENDGKEFCRKMARNFPSSSTFILAFRIAERRRGGGGALCQMKFLSEKFGTISG